MAPVAEFPAKLRVLFQPFRYKVLLGGRGSGKSWGIARALLIMGAQRPLRVLCARETQKSINDSVHKLLEDQIQALGLQGYYVVEKGRILGANGTEFTFAGLKHNINNIKSLESYDIVWVEEAQTVSKTSWDKLIPTIRKDGSEIWVSYNPELKTDDTHQRFAINPPPNSVIVRINWRDNPWFPEVLREEMETLRAKDEDDYLHVYEGHCISNLKDAIYANQLRLVDSTNRITRIGYDATRPVHTIWDLGIDDSTTIWFVQVFPFEFRFIDFLEGSGQGLPYYLKELPNRPYVYGTDYLPHDGRARELGTGKSIEELMRAAGRKVSIVPRLSLVDGINAARTLFGQCWFDGEKCEEGLNALRHYRYGEKEEIDPRTGQLARTQEPIHDWSSHAADAFRYAAVGLKPPKSDQKKPPKGPKPRHGPWS
jgi:phage terminase large subunit